MKKLILIAGVALLAAGCNAGQAGLQENVYPLESSTNQLNNAPAANSEKTTNVKVAVIALGDAGKLGEKIGCDDSVVFLDRTVPYTTATLNAAFEQLFALKTTEPADSKYSKAELSNIIYVMQQNSGSKALKYDRVTLDKGVAKVYLTGSMGGLGGVCDSPRVPAQIEGTAKQFSTVTSVKTYLNNKEVNWKEFSSQK